MWIADKAQQLPICLLFTYHWAIVFFAQIQNDKKTKSDDDDDDGDDDMQNGLRRKSVNLPAKLNLARRA